ncbi:NAD(P)H-binding protein [Nonomuraea gerenzanensis]|uniref:Oxidoreductase n=1 Tax=Nonomuraea gerenzanensis TaxID=93944 RepID=A0A1M4EGQ7_9ACTN|nr:NAD(P)H-binding protein [Nonomuraea gerenzanensis]UBU09720.1 NAD(P)H-binding protein [Nonomuraea gerenzanensis]SBO98157.1 Oxidoreductase [Nonomuraea gerenzanensis]
MIVITGATGNIGRSLVRRLHGHDPLAVVRRPIEDLGGPYTLADFEQPRTIGGLLSPGDRLFLNSGLWPGVVEAHRAVIDLAAEAGVAQIVAVSVRDAAPGAPLGMGMHGEIDEHLRKSGVPYAILQPTGFMQTLPRDVRDGTLYGAYGPAPVNYIDTRDLADVAAALLTAPVGPGREYLLTGPESLSHEAIAAEITGALGREVRYVNLSVAEMAAHLERQGVPEPFAGELARLQARTGDGSWAPVTTVVRELTGHAPRSWQDFLAGHRDAFA